MMPSGSDAAGATIASTSPSRSNCSAAASSAAGTASRASLSSTTAVAPPRTATFVVSVCVPKMLPSTTDASTASMSTPVEMRNALLRSRIVISRPAMSETLSAKLGVRRSVSATVLIARPP